MSIDNSIWMGDIQPWMNEDFIMQSFNYYNIQPKSVKLIHDRNTHDLKNFCFIYFQSIEEANNCILLLNGKSIPRTKIKFKLNWANYYSTFNKSVYVGNLSPDVDDISLYKLFKEKYSSVHHASVVTDKGKSKGFGFILFRGENDYERCLKEMNGINFHGSIIKVREQRRKEDEDKNNNSNHNHNYDNYIYNINYINDFDINNTHNNKINNNNIDPILLNNLYNSNKFNKNNVNSNTNTQLSNERNNRNTVYNLNEFQKEQKKFSYQNNESNINQNIINNIININNINHINDNNTINRRNNNNFNNFDNNTNKVFDLSNHPPSSYKGIIYSNEKIDNDLLIINKKSDINSDNKNNIIDNININNDSNNYKNKKDNKVKSELEIYNKYDEIELVKIIKENLDKMYNYYMHTYPGDINKLKCKLYYI